MEKEQLRIAIYARVSTKNGQDPEMQLAELREYIRNRKWKTAGEYVDKGISGVSDSRPELSRLIADANRRSFDAVAVWKFDRFARSVSHLLRALETFRALGIEFVSLSENIDTSTPTGKMVFTVLASVSELERSLIGERVRAGLRNAKARGTRLGRPSLKVLTLTETQRLRSERRRSRISFKELAGKYGVSVWTAFQLCKRAKA
jgi:DNA invertase Pin-like site-specific DNA recombinase